MPSYPAKAYSLICSAWKYLFSYILFNFSNLLGKKTHLCLNFLTAGKTEVFALHFGAIYISSIFISHIFTIQKILHFYICISVN